MPQPDPEGLEHLYSSLRADREIAFDVDTGHVMRREAWERIDAALDCLNALGKLGTSQEAEIVDVSELL